jgi:hypothetical protein
MNLRVAKKILKNQNNLNYHAGQIKKAEVVMKRSQRNAAKNSK